MDRQELDGVVCTCGRRLGDHQRGTATGLRWVVRELKASADRSYPWVATVDVIDCTGPRDVVGHHWRLPNLADPAYVAGPGVVIPAAARTGVNAEGCSRPRPRVSHPPRAQALVGGEVPTRYRQQREMERER